MAPAFGPAPLQTQPGAMASQSTVTVTVTVKLFASFRRDRFREARREFPAGTRISEVVADLGIQPAEIGMIVVCGRHAEMDRTLSEGDTLALFPLLGGG